MRLRSLSFASRTLSLFGLAAAIFAAPAQAGILREDLLVPDTVAGTIVGINSNGGASVFASGFQFPSDVAYFGGDFYATDYFANAVYKLTAHGSKSLFATISAPVGLAIDSSGNLFVASNPSGIFKVTSDGTVSPFAADFSFPNAIAIDSSDNVYVSDIVTGNITKITSGGSSSIFASGLSTPLGLAFSASGNLFVANGGNGTISRYTPGGAGDIYVSGLNGPTGLAFDFFDNLYVGSSNDGNISKISAIGSNVTLFYTGLSDPRLMNFAPVPEPSTVALLFGLGAISAAAVVRARRKAK